MRLDQWLVRLGLAPSRTKAQELIQSGSVEVQKADQWRIADSTSETFDDLTADQVRLRDQEILKYVSRGGLKLESALKHLGLDLQGWICVDCGQSTGGFTDALLQAGAARVVGFDVGQGQLHEKLRNDARVTAFENLHLKDAASSVPLARQRPGIGFDLVVADLSFVSAEKTLPFFAAFGRRLLLLVKPQFEVGAENLNKKGIVKDPTLTDVVRKKVQDLAQAHGWNVLDYFPSGVEGRDGNQEYFLYAERKGSGS